MAFVLPTRAINWSVKNAVRNWQYGPWTRSARGMHESKIIIVSTALSRFISVIHNRKDQKVPFPLQLRSRRPWSGMNRFNVIVKGDSEKSGLITKLLHRREMEWLSKVAKMVIIGNLANFGGEFQTQQIQLGWWPKYVSALRPSYVCSMQTKQRMGRFSKKFAHLHYFFVNWMLTQYRYDPLRKIAKGVKNSNSQVDIFALEINKQTDKQKTKHKHK